MSFEFKVWVHVLGCRSNLCDGDFLASDLASHGALVCSELEGADAAVIVTCSVTAEADRKCRQLVRRARKVLGASGVVAVCGCWAQGLTVDMAQELGIDLLAGTRGRAQLAAIIIQTLESVRLTGGRVFQDLRKSGNAETWEELPLQGTGLHTRAFIKVQEGCSHFCTYCIIPFLRGKPVSRPIESVKDEILRLLDQGYHEIVLTGTHLGAWGRDIDSSLATLIQAISGIPGLARLRMGSLEPFSLKNKGKNQDLLATLADCPVFMPHLHLPLQSGDDNVLARMKRGYTSAEFIQVCADARLWLGDNLHISSDILVGFPGEDEKAFENTLNVMKETGMGRAHVFPFSARAGTLAASFPEAISQEIKAARAERAIALGSELLNQYALRFVGSTVNALAESKSKTRAKADMQGYTEHYLEVSWPVDYNSSDNGNELVELRVTGVQKGKLQAVKALRG